MLEPDTTPGDSHEIPLQVVLTCGATACGHTFAPDPLAFTTARLACPCCGGWSFVAELAEPGVAEVSGQGGDR